MRYLKLRKAILFIGITISLLVTIILIRTQRAIHITHAGWEPLEYMIERNHYASDVFYRPSVSPSYVGFQQDKSLPETYNLVPIGIPEAIFNFSKDHTKYQIKAHLRKPNHDHEKIWLFDQQFLFPLDKKNDGTVSQRIIKEQLKKIYPSIWFTVIKIKNQSGWEFKSVGFVKKHFKKDLNKFFYPEQVIKVKLKSLPKGYDELFNNKPELFPF